MKLTPQTLAKKIRTTRHRLRLSQGAFAKKLGVSQQRLSDWETGKRLRAPLDGINLYLTLLKLGEKAGKAK